MNSAITDGLHWTLTGLYAGRVQAMPGDGRPTAIFKQPVQGAMAVGLEGLVADAQADRRVHGGPEKALHHFPAETYAQLAARFPQQAAQFQPGAMGENLSTQGLTEAKVRIGDVYQLGSVTVQLCQPRTPCWKINARFGVEEGITEYIAEHGIAGWYYRVLQPGQIQQGDRLKLIERRMDAPSLQDFWVLVNEHRPDAALLTALADVPGLAEGWRARLLRRLEWLKNNS